MSYFDEAAKKYDSWYETPVGSFVDKTETRLAFQLFTPQKGMTILDAGCGTGNFSIKLAQQGARVTGIDLSGGMLAVARHKAARNRLEIDFAEMDILQLAYPDNYFDAVFSMAVFEVIAEYQQAFQEMMRVLKPGQFLLIGTIRKDSAWGQSYIQRVKEKPDSIYRFSHFKTLQQLHDIDSEHLVKIGQCLFIPPDAPESQFNDEEENRLALTENGGFMAGLWQKPLQ